jgi:hypothetical protein
MTSTLTRVSAVLLVVFLVTPSAPAAAQAAARATPQALSPADARDFQMFRHNIAVRHNARVCERSLPDYSKTFDDLYGKWSERHRGEISRGESLFKVALKKQDPKTYPYIDRVTLLKVEEGLDELARPPQAAGPTPPAAQTKVACEKVLTFLKD